MKFVQGISPRPVEGFQQYFIQIFFTITQCRTYKVRPHQIDSMVNGFCCTKKEGGGRSLNISD